MKQKTRGVLKGQEASEGVFHQKILGVSSRYQSPDQVTQCSTRAGEQQSSCCCTVKDWIKRKFWGQDISFLIEKYYQETAQSDCDCSV